jgi:hypothetical protein
MQYNHLLPVIIEERARRELLTAFAKVPKDNAYENGHRIVNDSAVATAVDYVVSMMTSTLVPRVGNECIAYLGSNDLRYSTLSCYSPV